MNCKYCGAQIQAGSKKCPHCGAAVEAQPGTTNSIFSGPSQKNFVDGPQTALGFVIGLFLGLIGIIFGFVLYPQGSVARKTFFKGFIIACVISTLIPIIFFVIMIATTSTIHPFLD